MIRAATGTLALAFAALLLAGAAIGFVYPMGGDPALWIALVALCVALVGLWTYRIAVDGVALYLTRMKGIEP